MTGRAAAAGRGLTPGWLAAADGTGDAPGDRGVPQAETSAPSPITTDALMMSRCAHNLSPGALVPASDGHHAALRIAEPDVPLRRARASRPEKYHAARARRLLHGDPGPLRQRQEHAARPHGGPRPPDERPRLPRRRGAGRAR